MNTPLSKQQGTKSGYRLIGLFVLLFLTLTFAVRLSFIVKYADFYYSFSGVNSLSELALQAIPAEARSFIAAMLRLTADEYMHLGPTKKIKQNFMAGAFAGNTELIAMLGLSLVFEPSHIESYINISHNMAIYIRHFTDAIRFLQRGILLNRDSAELHKLYASGAFCYGFSKKYTISDPVRIQHRRRIAIKYIDKAIEAYLNKADEITGDADDFANLENYLELKCRFLIDIGQHQEALKLWQNPPFRVAKRTNVLSYYLSLLKNGMRCLPKLPEHLAKPEYKALLQQSQIRAPYNLPSDYAYWFCKPKDIYDLQLFAYGLGVIGNDSGEPETTPPVDAKDKGQALECTDPNCAHHHHHHHHHGSGDVCTDPNCEFCAQAKQEGEASILEKMLYRSLIMAVLTVIIILASRRRRKPLRQA